jgi:hypothetical protein
MERDLFEVTATNIHSGMQRIFLTAAESNDEAEARARALYPDAFDSENWVVGSSPVDHICVYHAVWSKNNQRPSLVGVGQSKEERKALREARKHAAAVGINPDSIAPMF